MMVNVFVRNLGDPRITPCMTKGGAQGTGEYRNTPSSSCRPARAGRKRLRKSEQSIVDKSQGNA